MTRAVVVVLALFALAARIAARVAGGPLLVTVGDVTATSAVIWARPPREGSLTLVLTPEGGPPSPPVTETATAVSDLTTKFVAADLRPRTRYRYRIASGPDAATGAFVTAPALEESAPVTFTWSGDLGGGGYCRPVDGGYRIFRPMEARPGDFFLFVGDTAYADQRCGRSGVVPGGGEAAGDLAGFRAKQRY